MSGTDGWSDEVLDGLEIGDQTGAYTVIGGDGFIPATLQAYFNGKGNTVIAAIVSFNGSGGYFWQAMLDTGVMDWGSYDGANIHERVSTFLSTDQQNIVDLHWMDAATGGEETWHAVSFTNWADAGGAEHATKYRRVPSPANCVQLIGTMNKGASPNADGTVLFTLPVGYRPASTVNLPLMPNVTVAGGVAPILVIASSGACSILGLTGATNVRVNGLFPLD